MLNLHVCSDINNECSKSNYHYFPKSLLVFICMLKKLQRNEKTEIPVSKFDVQCAEETRV